MQSQLKFVSFLPGLGMLAMRTTGMQWETLFLISARDLAPDRDMLTFKKLRNTLLVLFFDWLF